MSEVFQDIKGAIGTPSTFNELISGSLAGAAQVLVGQPLDTIKTRAQIAPRESTAGFQSPLSYFKYLLCSGYVCEMFDRPYCFDHGRITLH